jgi:hypothetical protein
VYNVNIFNLHHPCQKQSTSMTKYLDIIIVYTKRIMTALDKFNTIYTAELKDRAIYIMLDMFKH